MVFLQALPHPALQPYVGQYNYVSFNTALLPSLKQTFLPYDMPAISFFVGPVSIEHTKSTLLGPIAAPTPRSSFAYFNALTTRPFTLYFLENTPVSVFVIPFKPTGFSALFPHDMTELTNLLPDFEELAGASVANRLLDQLMTAHSFTDQVRVLDDYFLHRLAQGSNPGPQLREACHQLIQTDGLMPIRDLARHTNMPLRSLERQFRQRVGVGPKLFARFKRFHHALALMNRAHPPTWTDLAYQCGYYDQAHFIREFNVFSNQSPTSYSPQEYQLYNQIILARTFASY